MKKGVENEVLQKEALRVQFVEEQQQMTDEVFDQLFERYNAQLMGL